MFVKERAILYATLAFLISGPLLNAKYYFSEGLKNRCDDDCVRISVLGTEKKSGSIYWTRTTSSLLLECNTVINNPIEIFWLIDGVKEATSSQNHLEHIMRRTLETQIATCFVRDVDDQIFNATITFKAIVPVHNVSASFFQTKESVVTRGLGDRVQMICQADVQENVYYEWSVKYPGTNMWNFVGNTQHFEDIVILELDNGLTEYRCKAHNTANIEPFSELESNNIYVRHEDSNKFGPQNLCSNQENNQISPRITPTYWSDTPPPVQDSDNGVSDQNDNTNSKENLVVICSIAGTLSALAIIGAVCIIRWKQRRRLQNVLPMKPCTPSPRSSATTSRGAIFADVEGDTMATYIDLLPDDDSTVKMFIRSQMPLPKPVDISQFEENTNSSDHIYERMSMYCSYDP